MMLYILLPSEQACAELSRALWRICRPAPVSAAAKDQVQYLFGWHQHPVTGEWAMRFDSFYKYPRHPDVPAMLTAAGDPHGSQALLQRLFSPIAVSGTASLHALLTYILSSSEIDTAQVLLHVNPALVRTEAQMQSDGWFPRP